MGSNFLTAILLTSLAGLSTTIGSIISLFYRNPGPVFMAFIMGFSAGIMIFISFVELLQSGIDSVGFIYGSIAFFFGMVVLFIIDVLLPHIFILEDYKHTDSNISKLRKASIFTAIGIGIHNFPEGIATFAGTLKGVDIGISLAIAIAIHNIPEGIAVSVPVYAFTKSIRKSFMWSFISGVSEPFGAFIAGLILMPFLNDFVLGLILCAAGGLMVFIAFDELLPVSHSYEKEHISIIGVMTGMIIITISLALFRY